LFFLLNFSYLGISIGGGAALLAAGWKYGRELTQFLVGSYMLVFLGLICRENMQIEGFWFYIVSGIFTGATLHYLIATMTPVIARTQQNVFCAKAVQRSVLPRH